MPLRHDDEDVNKRTPLPHVHILEAKNRARKKSKRQIVISTAIGMRDYCSVFSV